MKYKDTGTDNCATFSYDDINHKIILTGIWTSSFIIEKNLLSFIHKLQHQDVIIIDGTNVIKMDTFGVFFIKKILRMLSDHNSNIALKLNQHDDELLTLLSEYNNDTSDNNSTIQPENISFVNHIYTQIHSATKYIASFLNFLGHIIISTIQTFKMLHLFDWRETVKTIKTCGMDSLLVVMLLNFLIATTLAYEMVPQFIKYGANLYIVNFLGIAILKEVSPLLTALIIAGRTGSAITAEIGTMKIQEEIDALMTMGISPIKKLVLPKILGVTLAVPLLSAMGDLVGIIGGAIVANQSLGIPYGMFIERLHNYTAITNYTSGIMKSIAFGFSIAFIGCLHGFLVQGNANSIGIQTTKSVVSSIIAIVFFDAIFAIIFYNLKI